MIVRTYKGFMAKRTFEREAGRLAEKGYVVQSVTAMGHQLVDFKTKQSTIGRGLGIDWGSHSKVNTKDGGIVVTYGLSDERRADLAGQVEMYPARMHEYDAAMAAWKAKRG